MRQTDEEFEQEIQQKRELRKIEKEIRSNLEGADLKIFRTGVNNEKVMIYVSGFEFLEEVITKYPPTKLSRFIEHGRTENELLSPYKLDIENKVRESADLAIRYISGNHEVWIKGKMPPDIKAKYCVIGNRNLPTSCYHYFTGVSGSQLRSMKLPDLKWNSNYKMLNWYGGQHTLMDEYAVELIMESLKKLKKEA